MVEAAASPPPTQAAGKADSEKLKKEPKRGVKKEIERMLEELKRKDSRVHETGQAHSEE